MRTVWYGISIRGGQIQRGNRRVRRYDLVACRVVTEREARDRRLGNGNGGGSEDGEGERHLDHVVRDEAPGQGGLTAQHVRSAGR